MTTPTDRDIVCGTVGNNFILITRIEAIRLDSVHDAIRGSETWGEFKRRLGPEDWEQVLSGLAYLTLAEHRDENSFASDVEAWESYISLPLGDRMPIDSDPFEADLLPGYSDGDWPEWPAQQALYWVPGDIQQRFGETNSSVLNGSFLELDPRRAGEIIAAMEEAGYLCERNDALVLSASGQF